MMTRTLCTALFSLMLITSTPAAYALARPGASGRAPGAAELAQLRASQAPQLLQQRAGKRDPHRELRAGELTTLREAQRKAPELSAMRGGAITNDDLITIAVIAGLVILIIIVA
jgi:hypothetical protein